MNIYDLLKSDHQEVLAVLGALAQAEDSKLRRDLVTQVKDLLVPHSRAEEMVLYNVLRDMEEARDLIRHAYAEHVKAETLLRGLQVSEAIALKWRSGVEKLTEDLFHHITNEESVVFAAAKRVLTEEEAMALGGAFTQLKANMKSGFLSSQIELITNLMPQKFRRSFVESLEEGDESQRAS